MSRSGGTIEPRPALSVGMPVYNGEQWLEAAAESMLGQTFGDIELIISDNASVDRTQALAERLVARDPRVRFVRNAENLGVAYNYNQVARLARGRFFKWASVSDYCDPTMLEQCVRVLEARGDAVLCYPRAWLVTPDGTVHEYEHDLDLAESSPCARFRRLLQSTRLNNMLNGVIRTEVLRRVHPHGAYMASDVPLIAELVLHGKFLLLPERLFYRRAEAFDLGAERLRLHQTNRRRYFDPQGRSPMLFQQWKLLLGLCKAASRARIPVAERWCVYRYLLKQVVWSRRGLWDDVVLAATSPWRRAQVGR